MLILKCGKKSQQSKEREVHNQELSTFDCVIYKNIGQFTGYFSEILGIIVYKKCISVHCKSTLCTTKVNISFYMYLFLLCFLYLLVYSDSFFYSAYSFSTTSLFLLLQYIKTSVMLLQNLFSVFSKSGLEIVQRINNIFRI